MTETERTTHPVYTPTADGTGLADATTAMRKAEIGVLLAVLESDVTETGRIYLHDLRILLRKAGCLA